MKQENTTYQVEVEEYLNFHQKRIISYFYQPLIGQKAFILYNFLLEEEQFARNVELELELKRLYAFLSINKEELFFIFQILENFNLLQKFYNPKLLNWFFLIKKPLSVSTFCESVFFTDFEKKVDEKTIEQVYFWLRPNNLIQTNSSLEKKSIKNDNLQNKIHNFLLKIKCFQKQNYNLKKKDINFIDSLHHSSKISLNVIELMIEFCFYRINNFSLNYLKQILKTLQKKQIDQNFLKVKKYFQNLYENTPFVTATEKQDNYQPIWLNKFNNKLTKKTKPETKSNLNFKNFDKFF